MGPTNDYETHVQTALAQVPCPWPSRRPLHGSFDADGISTLWVRVKLTVSKFCRQIWLAIHMEFLRSFLQASFHVATRKVGCFSQAAEEPWKTPGVNYTATSGRTPYRREVQLQPEGFLIVSSSVIYDDVGWWMKVPVSLWTAPRLGVRGVEKREQTARGKMKEGKCGSNVIPHFVVPRSIILSLFTGMRYNRIQTVNSKTRVRPNLDWTLVRGGFTEQRIKWRLIY